MPKKSEMLLKSSLQTSIYRRCLSTRSLPCQSTYAHDHGASRHQFPGSASALVSRSPETIPKAVPLSILPLDSVIRSLAIMSMSSSTMLLRPSLSIMSTLAHSRSAILSPDTNPILRFLLKKTFYKQFCAGENASEVNETVDGLKSMGFKGVILGYAREVVMDEKQTDKLTSYGNQEVMEACIRDEITPWAKGTLETVRLTCPGDFVALKFTGAGSQALYDLSRQASPSPALKEAIDSVCDLAAASGVRLLFDAEQQAVQAGIDAWTLDYMRKYNRQEPGNAVVYGTYQSYLKATPSILASHLAAARKEGFTLGVKLVRGAYLGSDPRHLIHDTKGDTDTFYNGIAESLCRRAYGPILKAPKGETEFPSLNVVLAGHNHESVRKIQALRTMQVARGEPQIDLVYAQLQGMADEVSCDLVQAGKVVEGEQKVDIPKAYKYLVWGTTGECMKYLLRRAQENKDAVQRTKDGRNAMAAELFRRLKSAVGFGFKTLELHSSWKGHHEIWL